MASGQLSFESRDFSRSDPGELQDLVPLFVADHVQSYERHMYEDHRRLDECRWKLALQREFVRVFCEQPLRQRKASGAVAREERDLNELQQRERSRTASGASASDTSDSPALLLIGTIEGTLDDAMFGLHSPTTPITLVRSSYIHDKIVDCAILSTLLGPSEFDPFRSQTVKWAELGRPHALGAIVKNRDFVFVEATGLAHLSNGEPIGYHAIHSVDFDYPLEATRAIRGNLAVCTVFRQRSDMVLDVFGKMRVDLGGSVVRSLALKLTAATFVSVGKAVHCARMKKLAWFVLHRRQPRIDGSVGAPPVLDTRAESARACVTCGQKLSQHRPIGLQKNSCMLCTEPVCSSCKLKKSLSFLESDDDVRRHDMWFCARCISGSARANGRFLAQEGLQIPSEGAHFNG